MSVSYQVSDIMMIFLWWSVRNMIGHLIRGMAPPACSRATNSLMVYAGGRRNTNPSQSAYAIIFIM